MPFGRLRGVTSSDLHFGALARAPCIMQRDGCVILRTISVCRARVSATRRADGMRDCATAVMLDTVSALLLHATPHAMLFTTQCSVQY
eukprot:6770501-Pyramimonas_sp.AAC.1